MTIRFDPTTRTLWLSIGDLIDTAAFPGSVPLYKNGILVGGLGISGDGVEQDDFIAGQASVNFAAPTAIRADQFSIRGVRLPYLKFPRDPTL